MKKKYLQEIFMFFNTTKFLFIEQTAPRSMLGLVEPKGSQHVVPVAKQELLQRGPTYMENSRCDVHSHQLKSPQTSNPVA